MAALARLQATGRGATRGGWAVDRANRQASSVPCAALSRMRCSARAASPTVPLTNRRSPTRRRTVAASAIDESMRLHRDAPMAARGVATDQLHIVLPASPENPSTNARNQACLGRQGNRQVTHAGSAPIAARSPRLTASALWPSASGATVGRKCRPRPARIDTDRETNAGRHVQQRTVVANTERHIGTNPVAWEKIRSDQVKFGERHSTVRSAPGRHQRTQGTRLVENPVDIAMACSAPNVLASSTTSLITTR